MAKNLFPVGASFRGFEQLGALLKELPEATEKQILQKATLKAMRAGATRVRTAAPKDLEGQSAPSRKYGRLSRNIRVMALRRVQKGRKAARIHTGRAFWGLFLEKGTRYIAANPWFGPAIESAQTLIFNVLGEEIGRGIRDLAGKYKGGR